MNDNSTGGGETSHLRTALFVEAVYNVSRRTEMLCSNSDNSAGLDLQRATASVTMDREGAREKSKSSFVSSFGRSAKILYSKSRAR